MAGASDRIPQGVMLTAAQRGIASVCLLALLTSVGVASPVSAVADPPPGGGVVVTPAPGQGGVGIGVGLSSGAGPATAPVSGSGDEAGGSTDPCVYEPANPPPGPDTPVGAEISKNGGSAIYEICPGGSGGLVWMPPGKAAPAPPTALQLAQRAYGELALPKPTPSRYPNGALRDGRPYTVVQTHMWFSTSSASWLSLSKKVCAGALCATATAEPNTLSFDPGNGDSSVSCPGPGTTFHRPSGGSWVPGRQPQGCDYQYTKSSYGNPDGEVTSTYAIGWTVTWTATNGQGGAFDDLQSAATSRFAVAELQSVVTR